MSSNGATGGASDTVFYFHYPRLVLTDSPTPVLGGELTRLNFKEFVALDPDWAHETYFARTSPAVWRRVIPLCEAPALNVEDFVQLMSTTERLEYVQPDVMNVYSEMGMLIYAAIIVATGGAFPDPRLSMQYLRFEKGVIRLSGLYHRTALLSGEREAPLPPGQVTTIAALASRWASAGLKHDDAIFAPVRALSLTASSSLPLELTVLPLVVSVEGYLLSRKTRGIASAIAERAGQLLGPSAPPDLGDFIRSVYAWRSDIVHGRPLFSIEHDWPLYTRLRRFVADLVASAVDRIINMGLTGNDLAPMRRPFGGS